MHRDWNQHYASGNTPWDGTDPAPELVALAEQGRLPRGRALDIGCGTGACVRYLASRGYEVVGVDVSPLAIERAKALGGASSAAVALGVGDFLAAPPQGPFDLVFDRGCFHVFDAAADRARFAERVAGCLAPTGLWLSLIGSTEGPARDHGPPRRSARDLVLAVEPSLRIVELREFVFDAGPHGSVAGWILLAGRRAVPAQPSSV